MVPMGIGDDQKIYNINADITAGAIAKELNARRLLLMTDVEGVLDHNNKLITEINSAIANKMLDEGHITSAAPDGHTAPHKPHPPQTAVFMSTVSPLTLIALA